MTDTGQAKKFPVTEDIKEAMETKHPYYKLVVVSWQDAERKRRKTEET